MWEPPPAMSVRPVRQTLKLTVLVAALFAAPMCVIAVIGFTWSVGENALGTVLGACVFGALEWLVLTRRSVPARDAAISGPPTGLDVGPTRVRDVVLEVVSPTAGSFTLAALLLEDVGVLGSALVPGQALGAAVASAAVLHRVRRWEARDGRELLLFSGTIQSLHARAVA